MNTNVSEQLKQCTTTEEYLKILHVILDTQEKIPRAESLWGGADVVIRFKQHPHNKSSSFYPAPRMVCSKHARELSWLFEILRDAFYLESLVDGCSKIEFFGRLANAANKKIAEKPEVSLRELCGAVYNEAVNMYSEIKQHKFKFLLIAFGREIAGEEKKKNE